jgi:hypothetical protein
LRRRPEETGACSRALEIAACWVYRRIGFPQSEGTKTGGRVKRILEDSPVRGYQLFRYARVMEDGTTVVSPVYYIRHRDKEVCTGLDRLQDAKALVKKKAGEDAQRFGQLANPGRVKVGDLLDLVIEDYKTSGQAVEDARAKIEQRPPAVLRGHAGGLARQRHD